MLTTSGPHLLQPLAPALTWPIPSLQDMVVDDLDEDMEGAAAAPAPKPASGGHAGARRVLAVSCNVGAAAAGFSRERQLPCLPQSTSLWQSCVHAEENEDAGNKPDEAAAQAK